MLSGLAFAEPQVIHLWPNGAPGFESRKDEPEQAKDWWVRNVNNPSLTVFLPPAGKSNGCAVVVAPGGGFSELVFNGEGRQVAEFLNPLGVTVFVLKTDCRARRARLTHSSTCGRTRSARCGSYAAARTNSKSIRSGSACSGFRRAARW